MRNFFLVLFGVLFVISLVVWVVGAITAAVVQWFGGVRAAHIGAIGMGIASAGELAAGILEPLFIYILDKPDRRKHQTYGLPGGKKYGNKKPTAQPRGSASTVKCASV